MNSLSLEAEAAWLRILIQLFYLQNDVARAKSQDCGMSQPRCHP